MGRIQYWIVTLVAALGLLATAANIVLATQNRGAQAELSQRQQYVQQSLQLENLYREMARALVELGTRHNDQQVRALLQRHGITYSVDAPPAGDAARK